MVLIFVHIIIVSFKMVCESYSNMPINMITILTYLANSAHWREKVNKFDQNYALPQNES